MRVLAFDPSTAVTGWCCGTETEKPTFGSITLQKREELGEKLAMLRMHAAELIVTLRPDLISIEKMFMPIDRGPKTPKFKDGSSGRGFFTRGETSKPDDGHDDDEIGSGGRGAKMNAATTEALFKVEGVLMEVSAAHDVPIEQPAPRSWRASFLPGVKYQESVSQFWKRETMRKCRMMGWEPSGFDESDAGGIFFHTLHGKAGLKRKQGDLLAMAKSKL